MKFPYQIFRGAYYPIIPVIIIKDGNRIKTSCIVDTGATIPIFQSSIAKLLELDIESGEKHVFQGASAKLIGYIHKVGIAISDKEFECRVAFSEELSTSFNLLGRQDVFNNFKICFDESEKIMEFIPK